MGYFMEIDQNVLNRTSYFLSSTFRTGLDWEVKLKENWSGLTAVPARIATG